MSNTAARAKIRNKNFAKSAVLTGGDEPLKNKGLRTFEQRPTSIISEVQEKRPLNWTRKNLETEEAPVSPYRQQRGGGSRAASTNPILSPFSEVIYFNPFSSGRLHSFDFFFGQQNDSPKGLRFQHQISTRLFAIRADLRIMETSFLSLQSNRCSEKLQGHRRNIILLFDYYIFFPIS